MPVSPADAALAEARDIFYAECWQYQDIIRASAKVLSGGDVDPVRLETLQRAVHSAKGGAGSFGYLALHRFAAALEDVLKALRAGEIDPTDEIRDLLLAGLDIVSAHIAAATDEGTPPEDAETLAGLRAVLGGEAAEAPADAFGFAPLAVDLHDFDDLDEQASPWCVHFAPAAPDLVYGREPLLLLRELGVMGGGVAEADLSALPPLARLDPRKAYIGWTIHLPAAVDRTAIDACFDFLSPDARIEIARSPDRPDVGTAGALRA